MNPQLFGESATPLYGVLHPSALIGTTRVAAVLCAPLGNEYLQAHRALRMLADLLADRGIPALRFDYLGTGDSAGNGDEVTLTQMTTDVGHAIAEVRGITRARKVVLVALRGGAFPAIRSAGDPSVVGCVLWHPILKGEVAIPFGTGRDPQAVDRTISLGGSQYCATLQRELAAFDADEELTSSARDIRIVADADTQFAALEERGPRLKWTRTLEKLDFGAPGSQDLLHVAERQLAQVADAVEEIARS